MFGNLPLELQFRIFHHLYPNNQKEIDNLDKDFGITKRQQKRSFIKPIRELVCYNLDSHKRIKSLLLTNYKFRSFKKDYDFPPQINVIKEVIINYVEICHNNSTKIVKKFKEDNQSVNSLLYYIKSWFFLLHFKDLKKMYKILDLGEYIKTLTNNFIYWDGSFGEVQSQMQFYHLFHLYLDYIPKEVENENDAMLYIKQKYHMISFKHLSRYNSSILQLI